ncbi:MAG: phage holin family protein [Anaerolineae bacterium]|nr:phage holin family protein [Anaerolineae bacterium]
MRNFVLRVIINAIGIAVVAEIVPGISIGNDHIGTLILIGLVFGILNAILKPILILLTCPAVLLSLGLFILVINGVMLLCTASVLPNRLQIDGFWPALLGGIVMSILSLILESLLGVKDNKPNKPGKNGGDPNVIVIDNRR